MLLYVVCTAGDFVWNGGGVVQLPAPYITFCLIHPVSVLNISNIISINILKFTVPFQNYDKKLYS